MNISKALIRKFQETHQRKFGKGVSEKMAAQDLLMLANLIKIIIESKFKEDQQ